MQLSNNRATGSLQRGKDKCILHSDHKLLAFKCPILSKHDKRYWNTYKRHAHCLRASSSTDGPTETARPLATLYSNINPRTHSHEPGTLWGATLLVAGTTVGAGILALPAVTQESGFAATCGTLGGCALFAMTTGLLLAEVQMNVVARTGRDNVTFTSMAELTLGPAGASAATFLYLFHNYALLVAYVARAGQILATASGTPPLAASAVFALSFGGLCYVSTPRQFDQINGVLLGLAAGAFLALLTVAGSEVDFPVLGTANWYAVPPTIPVIALAFVYHNVVPLVVHNLECDAGKVRTSIVLGVLVPLGMYLLWDGAILGSINNLGAAAAEEAAAAAAVTAAAAAAVSAAEAATAAADAAAAAAVAVAADSAVANSAAAVAADAAATAAAAAAAAAAASADATGAGGGAAAVSTSADLTAALDPLVLLQRSGGPLVGPLVQGFSFLAIATSFTGFVLAATDFLPDAFRPLSTVPRAGRYALIVLPPILLSTASPGVFFAALDIAGTYGVMTLYGMMPAAMAWASRYGSIGGGDGSLSETAAAAAAAVAGMEFGSGPLAMDGTVKKKGQDDLMGSSVGTEKAILGTAESSGGGLRGVVSGGAARNVELVPGGPAVLLVTGAAAAAVIVSQWVI